jgi:hypothetical protein
MVHRQLPRDGAEPPPAGRVRRQLEDRLGHRCGITRRHHHAAAATRGGQLAALGLRDHRPSAGEHPGEL